MGRNNKVRKFAEMKRTLKSKDKRLKQPEKKKKLGQFDYLLQNYRIGHHGNTVFSGTQKKANDGTIIDGKNSLYDSYNMTHILS